MAVAQPVLRTGLDWLLPCLSAIARSLPHGWPVGTCCLWVSQNIFMKLVNIYGARYTYYTSIYARVPWYTIISSTSTMQTLVRMYDTWYIFFVFSSAPGCLWLFGVFNFTFHLSCPRYCAHRAVFIYKDTTSPINYNNQCCIAFHLPGATISRFLRSRVGITRVCHWIEL